MSNTDLDTLWRRVCERLSLREGPTTAQIFGFEDGYPPLKGEFKGNAPPLDGDSMLAAIEAADVMFWEVDSRTNITDGGWQHWKHSVLVRLPDRAVSAAGFGETVPEAVVRALATALGVEG